MNFGNIQPNLSWTPLREFWQYPEIARIWTEGGSWMRAISSNSEGTKNIRGFWLTPSWAEYGQGADWSILLISSWHNLDKVGPAWPQRNYKYLTKQYHDSPKTLINRLKSSRWPSSKLNKPSVIFRFLFFPLVEQTCQFVYERPASKFCHPSSNRFFSNFVQNPDPFEIYFFHTFSKNAKT